jgi:hypothetical protein
VILRYLIEKRGSGDVEERFHMCIGDRNIWILGDEKITAGEVVKFLKRDGPIVIALQWRTGVIHIGDRDLEGSVNECYRNRDIPKHDFPITTGVWAIGARA